MTDSDSDVCLFRLVLDSMGITHGPSSNHFGEEEKENRKGKKKKEGTRKNGEENNASEEKEWHDDRVRIRGCKRHSGQCRGTHSRRMDNG